MNSSHFSRNLNSIDKNLPAAIESLEVLKTYIELVEDERYQLLTNTNKQLIELNLIQYLIFYCITNFDLMIWMLKLFVIYISIINLKK